MLKGFGGTESTWQRFRTATSSALHDMAISIGDDINAATRSYHTSLNQLILQFLPFSLPPHTSNSHLYALGISHFLPIYSAFESCLRAHRRRSNTSPSRITDALRALYIHELERAEALANDINILLPPLHRDSSPIEHQFARLEAFKRHIDSSLASKPHLLFAYTWIFYMALFSGGRYIRSKLRAAFTNPNTSKSQHHLDELAGLSFWNFPGDADGEDLKIEFKARVASLSNDLTEEEIAEIIAEGVHIMVSLPEIVREVADTVPERALALTEAATSDTTTQLKDPVARIRPPWILLLRSIFPMGFIHLVSAATGIAASKGPPHGAGTPMSMQVAAK
ncbi:MAG: hypothetical protein L6R36_004217 [Xanthoria steineri]|nr:MAG: hypothetical protein L6R36_004217 [Xanthoria steineri]